MRRQTRAAIPTRFAHLLVFMPRGSARGDLNLATNIRGLRHAPRGSDRPSSARENQEQRSEAKWKMRSPVIISALARPEAPAQGQRDAHSKLPPANLPEHQRSHPASPMKAPFFASERVPRRRGQTSRSRIQILRPESTHATSPRGLLFSTHAQASNSSLATPAIMKAGVMRTGENKISAAGQKT